MPKILLGNVKGPRGADGQTINIKGYYADIGALQSAHESGEQNDAYNVGGKIYVWDPEHSEWKELDVTATSLGDVTGKLVEGAEPALTVDTDEADGKKNLTFSLQGATPAVFEGAGSEKAGVAGLVPAPEAGLVKAYLRSDGMWIESAASDEPDKPIVDAGTIWKMPWADLDALGKNVAKDPSKYENLIGAEKSITTSGMGTYTVVIVGLAHHDKPDASGKAGFTFQFKETITTAYRMYNTAPQKADYAESDMHRTTLPTILEALPADLKSAICQVNIPYSVWNGTVKDTHIGDQWYDIKYAVANLFLASSREVWGTMPLYSNGLFSGEKMLTGADGTQLAYWAKHQGLNDHIKCKSGTETKTAWWGRSGAPQKTSFTVVEPDGWATYALGDYTNGTVPSIAPCFCIG